MKRKQELGADFLDGNAADAPKVRHVTLPKGIVHIEGFLDVEEQSTLLKSALEIGSKSFFSCDNEKTRRMKMMNLGRHVHGTGSNEDAIPESWQELALRAYSAAKERDPSLPVLLAPDVCVVNGYTTRSKLAAHVDVLTRRDPGSPIVSLSVGLACDFVFKKGWGKKVKEHTLRLESGDALVFGGAARSVIHSVPRIHALGPAGLGDTLLAGVPRAHIDALLFGIAAPSDAAAAEKPNSRRTSSTSSLSEEACSSSSALDGALKFRLNFNCRER